LRGGWSRADKALLRYAREQAAGPPAVELSPAERAQAERFRRVLAALGPDDLAAAGLN
jgi:hypothetical protein